MALWRKKGNRQGILKYQKDKGKCMGNELPAQRKIRQGRDKKTTKEREPTGKLPHQQYRIAKKKETIDNQKVRNFNIKIFILH